MLLLATEPVQVVTLKLLVGTVVVVVVVSKMLAQDGAGDVMAANLEDKVALLD
jgi:hypothetical protein